MASLECARERKCGGGTTALQGSHQNKKGKKSKSKKRKSKKGGGGTTALQGSHQTKKGKNRKRGRRTVEEPPHSREVIRPRKARRARRARRGGRAVEQPPPSATGVLQLWSGWSSVMR
jgi:hypothetical protein